MASLNKIMLIGNLGQDAEMKESSSGNRYLSFGIATNKWNNETEQEEPIWHNINYWANKNNQNSLDKLEPYMTKGKQVYVEASLSYYKDNDGVKRVSINANKVDLLGARGELVSNSDSFNVNQDDENGVPF